MGVSGPASPRHGGSGRIERIELVGRSGMRCVSQDSGIEGRSRSFRLSDPLLFSSFFFFIGFFARSKNGPSGRDAS